jgi:putative ABC transport system permease protein
MFSLIYAVLTQCLTFLPLALAIYISFSIMNATDMTLDGSFVLGAGVFARLLELGFNPLFAGLGAILSGAAAGMMVAIMQRRQKIDPLLAGVLATFILTSGNLIIMSRPNISLLTQHTLLSDAFNKSDGHGWLLVAVYTGVVCLLVCAILRSRAGLLLRAFGDNPNLLQRMGKNVELFRMCGFAFTNCLAAVAGCLTAQTVGYADISMGFGMTLTGLGAIILGQQVLRHIFKKHYLRTALEFTACLCGVVLYFLAMNGLLRLDINPIYLKMILGVVLVFFLRAATQRRAA